MLLVAQWKAIHKLGAARRYLNWAIHLSDFSHTYCLVVTDYRLSLPLALFLLVTCTRFLLNLLEYDEVVLNGSLNEGRASVKGKEKAPAASFHWWYFELPLIYQSHQLLPEWCYELLSPLLLKDSIFIIYDTRCSLSLSLSPLLLLATWIKSVAWSPFRSPVPVNQSRASGKRRWSTCNWKCVHRCTFHCRLDEYKKQEKKRRREREREREERKRKR